MFSFNFASPVRGTVRTKLTLRRGQSGIVYHYEATGMKQADVQNAHTS